MWWFDVVTTTSTWVLVLNRLADCGGVGVSGRSCVVRAALGSVAVCIRFSLFESSACATHAFYLFVTRPRRPSVFCLRLQFTHQLTSSKPGLTTYWLSNAAQQWLSACADTHRQTILHYSFEVLDSLCFILLFHSSSSVLTTFTHLVYLALCRSVKLNAFIMIPFLRKSNKTLSTQEKIQNIYYNVLIFTAFNFWSKKSNLLNVLKWHILLISL